MEHRHNDPPWEFSWADEGEMGAVLELTRQEYGHDTIAHPDYWRWLTRGGPAGSLCTWVARVGGEVVAAVMAQPVRATIGGREVLAHYSLNAIVRTDQRGRGLLVSLMNWVAAESWKLGAAIRISTVGPGVTRLAPRVCGVVQVGRVGPLLVRPLDVSAILAYKRVHSSLARWVAVAAHRLVAPLLETVRVVEPGPALTVEPITAFDARFDQFWEKTEDKYDVMLVRDSAFLQWRYLDVPRKAATCWAATDGDGGVIAYIAFRSANLDGLAAGIILDLVIERSEEGRRAGRLLVAEATRAFEAERLAAAVCLMLPHTDEIAALREHGYLSCPRSLEPHPVSIFCRFDPEQLSSDQLTPAGRWFLTLGDWGIDAYSA